MKITAFDLSLTGTGWTRVDATPALQTGKSQDGIETWRKSLQFGTFKTTLTGMERLEFIRNSVYQIVKHSDLVVFEDLAFGAHDTNHERAGLAMLVRFMLWKKGIPYVLVAPTTLKKFVTGRGNSEKSGMMLAVYKNWKHDVKNDNEADALGLLHIGLMLMGLESPGSKSRIEVGKTLLKSHSWLKEMKV